MSIARTVAGSLKRAGPRTAALAGSSGLAIGLISGVIGVGGGELRLPVLLGLLGFAAKVATPINLIVTAITVLGGITARAAGDGFAATRSFAIEAIVLAVAAAPSAYIGAHLLSRLTSRKLARLVAILLLAVGVLMFLEATLGGNAYKLAVDDPPVRLGLCVLFGIGIGIVVGLFGVGGNELMIPPLVIVFGLPIKEAGSISLLVSVPVVLVSLWRHHATGAFRHRDRDVTRTIVPLAAGSILGALCGGFLAPLTPNDVLKYLLGAILIFSAWRTYAEQPPQKPD